MGVQHEKQIEKLKQEINILTAEKQKEINENIRKENEINQLKYETEKLNQVIKTNTQQFNKANEEYKSQINNLQNEINSKNNKPGVETGKQRDGVYVTTPRCQKIENLY